MSRAMPPGRVSDTRPPLRLVVSLLLHGAAVLALALLVRPSSLTSPEPAPAFTVESAPPVTETVLGAAELPPPAPVTETRASVAPLRPVYAAHAASEPAASLPRRSAMRSRAPEASAAVPPRVPVPPAAPPPDSAALLDGFTAEIDRAVQAAAAFPAMARAQRRQGRVEIRFDLLDGAVTSVSVAQSSGSVLLDAAAVRAVRTAKMPPEPPPLAARTLRLLVPVRFALD